MCADRLVVFSGPPGSGKTTLIRSLQVTATAFLADELEPRQRAVWEQAQADNAELVRRLPAASVLALADHLGLGDALTWKCLEAMDLALIRRQGTGTGFSLTEYVARALHQCRLDRVILHYGMLGPWRRVGESRGYDRDEQLVILDLFDEIIFVTLWVAPELLRERLKAKVALLCESIVSRPVSGLQRLRTALRLIQIRRLCANVPELVQQYDRWFEFCDSYKAKAHWIVDNSEVPKLFPDTRWQAVRSRVLNPWERKP